MVILQFEYLGRDGKKPGFMHVRKNYLLVEEDVCLLKIFISSFQCIVAYNMLY